MLGTNKVVGGGKFHLIREIPGGGMGTLWLAYKIASREHRVLKFPRDKAPVSLVRLSLEADHSQILRHKNIVKVYGLHRECLIVGLPFLELEFIDGWDFRKFLDSQAA